VEGYITWYFYRASSLQCTIGTCRSFDTVSKLQKQVASETQISNSHGAPSLDHTPLSVQSPLNSGCALPPLSLSINFMR
jgi:hypothetical protein